MCIRDSSNTQTINPDALGHSEDERVENLVQVMDGYFDQGAHHLNVNVFGKEKLLDAKMCIRDRSGTARDQIPDGSVHLRGMRFPR